MTPPRPRTIRLAASGLLLQISVIAASAATQAQAQAPGSVETSAVTATIASEPVAQGEPNMGVIAADPAASRRPATPTRRTPTP